MGIIWQYVATNVHWDLERISEKIRVNFKKLFQQLSKIKGILMLTRIKSSQGEKNQRKWLGLKEKCSV